MHLVSRISCSREDRDVKFKGVGRQKKISPPPLYEIVFVRNKKTSKYPSVLTIFVLFGILLPSWFYFLLLRTETDQDYARKRL